MQKNADGSVTVGGKKLPAGAVVVTKPDGSVTVEGKVLDIQYKFPLCSYQDGCLTADAEVVLSSWRVL